MNIVFSKKCSSTIKALFFIGDTFLISRSVVSNFTKESCRRFSFCLQDFERLNRCCSCIRLSDELLYNKFLKYPFKLHRLCAQFTKNVVTSSHLNFQFTNFAGATDAANSQPDQQSVKNESNENYSCGVLSLDEIYEFLVQENARDIVVIRLDKSVNYVDYFIVVTANSTRHLAFMAETLNRLYKERKSVSDPFTLIEGKRTARDWQCIDFGNSVVHFMLEEVREKYQLEKLWILGSKFDDLTHETPTLEELLEKVSDQGLFLLSDPGDSAEYADEVEIVNPWEIEYKSDQLKPDEDEDAYII